MTIRDPAVEIAGYVYYRSSYYDVWMVISPTSGFHSGYTSEAGILSFIRRELSLKGQSLEPLKHASSF